jgi:hypothetical protein
MTDDPPQGPSALRRLLRGVCAFATFFSAFFAAHGLLMTAQFLNDDIPAGRIEAILGTTKSGLRLRLDNGREVVFSNVPLFQRQTPLRLAFGDRVEKRPDSLVYVVNGTPITGFGWVLREWLLPVRLIVPLAAYLLVGTVYVLKYRRTPLGDLAWRDADPKRPRRPRSRPGMIAAVFATWLAVAVLETTIFGCMSGCLFGVGKAVSG